MSTAGVDWVDTSIRRNVCHTDPVVLTWGLYVHYGDEAVDDLYDLTTAQHSSLMGAAGSLSWAAVASSVLSAGWSGYSTKVKDAIEAAYVAHDDGAP